MLIRSNRFALLHALGGSLLALSPGAEARNGVLENEFQRTQELGDLANMETPVFARLGDGDTSIGSMASIPIRSSLDMDQDMPAFATSLDYSRAFNGAVLHFDGDSSPLQNRLGLGFSGGDTQFHLATGGGGSYAWTSALPGFSENAYFGFDSASYRWRGGDVSQRLGNDLQLRGGTMEIDLKDRVDPSVWHSGLSWRGFSGDYFATRRNGVTIGQGLALGFQVRNLDIRYQELRDINDHAIRAIQTTLFKGKQGTFELGLQAGLSPFTGINENRFMLTYSNRIGHKRGKLSSLESAPADATQAEGRVVAENRRYKKALIIGGSILGGAVALASTSGKADGGGGGFEAQHAAAREILNQVNPKSVRENKEYGGWIYRIADNTYAYTAPNVGQLDRVDLGAEPENATATYHTHAAYDPLYDNEHFSTQDIRVNDYYRVDGYLATPAGRFLFYNHSNGHIDQLGTVAN